MHLKDEDRAVGVKNFVNVTTSPVTKDELQKKFNVTRRDFMVGAGAATAVAATGLGAAYFNYSKVERPVRIGIIGTGDEGGVLIGALTPEYLDVVAIADIRPYNIHRAFHGDQSSPNAAKVRKGLINVYKDVYKDEDAARKHVKVYDTDYHDLLKDSNVEAVIIALPLHLHAKVAIKAMRAGKHVLTEKLMAWSIAECKEMSRVSFETGKILAVGHQRHYSVLYENSVDLIRLGLLGTVHHIRAQWHRQADTWSPTLPDEIFDPIKDKKSYDQQQELMKLKADYQAIHSDKGKSFKETFKAASGLLDREIKKRIEALQKAVDLAELKRMDIKVKATENGYQEMKIGGRTRSALEELIRWRLWKRTGGGLMAELGSHQLDASGIFISATRQDGNKVLPLSVNATGGVHLLDPNMRECEDHVYCNYEYPGPDYYSDFEKRQIKDENKKIVVTYSSINGNGYGGYGEVVMGDKGTLILEKEETVMLFKGNDTTTEVSVAKAKDGAIDTTASGPPQLAQKSVALGDVSKGYKEEMEHFAWCIRNLDEAALKEKKSKYEKLPRCHPKVAMADAVIALTTNISIRENRKIDFKPEWFDIDSDETPEGTKPRTMAELASI